MSGKGISVPWQQNQNVPQAPSVSSFLTTHIAKRPSVHFPIRLLRRKNRQMALARVHYIFAHTSPASLSSHPLSSPFLQSWLTKQQSLSTSSSSEALQLVCPLPTPCDALVTECSSSNKIPTFSTYGFSNSRSACRSQLSLRLFTIGAPEWRIQNPAQHV